MKNAYDEGRRDLAKEVVAWMNKISAHGMNINAMAKESAAFNTWLQEEAKK